MEKFVRQSKASANKGFAIAGVPSFADTFVQGGSSILRMKFSANKPRHRKPLVSSNCEADSIKA